MVLSLPPGVLKPNTTRNGEHMTCDEEGTEPMSVDMVGRGKNISNDVTMSFMFRRENTPQLPKPAEFFGVQCWSPQSSFCLKFIE